MRSLIAHNAWFKGCAEGAVPWNHLLCSLLQFCSDISDEFITTSANFKLYTI